MGPAGSSATAIVRFHRTVSADEFRWFAEAMGRSAADRPGYLGWHVSVLTSPMLDWSITATFRDEASLHRWLDAALLADPTQTAPLRASLDVVVAGSPRAPGLGLVHHRIEPGNEPAFITAQDHLAELAMTHPGYDGTTVLTPTMDRSQWTSVIRFRNGQQLQDWMESTTRKVALPQLQEQLGGEFQVITHTTFGSTVRISDGVADVTPSWKTTMVVLLVLYPTVMLLSRFVDPLIRQLGTDVWLTMFLSQSISVSLLTWVLMPAAGTALRVWLDPKTGAGWRASLTGAAVVVAGYLTFLTIFGSVDYLQFW